MAKSRRGRMLAEKQEWFARLIRQGVDNSEACRIVGVNRRTGTRWRYGRAILNTVGEAVHYPAVTSTASKPVHPRYLSPEERTTIADLRRVGGTQVFFCDAHSPWQRGTNENTVSIERARLT